MSDVTVYKLEQAPYDEFTIILMVQAGLAFYSEDNDSNMLLNVGTSPYQSINS